MGNTRDLSNRINESYSRLSKGQKLLATYITDNYDKAVFLTVNQPLCVLQHIWDTKGIRNSRMHWKNL